MRAMFVSVWIVIASTATGCMAGMMAGHAAHAAPEGAAPPPGAAAGGMGAMAAQACPMSVPGTRVAAVADTPDGESVTFVTAAEGAADLRARVRAMADMHNREAAGGATGGMQGGMGHGGMMMGGGADHGAMMPPPSRASVEDVEGGARISVTPNDPADLDRLRSAVRMHAQRMQESGTCEMAHHGSM